MLDIIVKGRHTGVPQKFRDYVDEKLVKVQKLDPKVISIDVEVSKERNPRMSDRRERVELTCHSRGPAIRAEAAAEDRYVALDQALFRLKERLRKAHDKRKIHRGTHTPTSVAEATTSGSLAGAANMARRSGGAAAESGELSAATTSAVTASPSTSHSASAGATRDEVAVDEPEADVPLETEGDGPLVVREKRHRAQPMTLDQALFQMELVGHDFYLFRDSNSGFPSVVYRRHGFHYGVIRLEE